MIPLPIVLGLLMVDGTQRHATHEAAPTVPGVNVSVPAASTPLRRKAERIAARLRKQGSANVSIRDIEKALQAEENLLSRRVTVTVTPDGGNTTAPVIWIADVAEHPEWIYLRYSWKETALAIDAAAIKRTLDDPFVLTLPRRHVSTVMATRVDNYNVERATSDGIARAGFDIDTAKMSQAIARALEKGISTVSVTAPYSEAAVRYPNEYGYMELSLLAEGRSDFADSTPGRESNVHKVLNERLHNIVVQPGETFWFNATLGGPVTLKKGWKEALALFGGGAAMAPGGGICQGATTMYRAAMLAGMPIVKRNPHSLYVDHYEYFGVGVDATIYPGIREFAFKNDTDNVIVLQAETQEPNAYVRIFGIPDGRSVTMDGPYFTRTKSKRPPTLRALGQNEIGWVRTVTNAAGEQRVEPIVSRYVKPVPSNLAAKYEHFRGMDSLLYATVADVPQSADLTVATLAQ